MRKFIVAMSLVLVGPSWADDTGEKAGPGRVGLVEMMQKREFHGRDPSEIPAMRAKTEAGGDDAQEEPPQEKKKKRGRTTWKDRPPVPGGLAEMMNRAAKDSVCPGTKGDEALRSVSKRRRGEC